MSQTSAHHCWSISVKAVVNSSGRCDLHFRSESASASRNWLDYLPESHRKSNRKSVSRIHPFINSTIIMFLLCNRSSMQTSSHIIFLRCWAPCCEPCAVTLMLFAWKTSHRDCAHASRSSVRSRCLWLTWMLRQGCRQRRWSYSHWKRNAQRLRFGIQDVVSL